ncbi:MAG: outer membrane beta-barrel protein [Cyclobacteriaceae bacterium]|nr:outer membrane beta-barrel protein [Cyclobacteriaceae bacterium]
MRKVLFSLSLALLTQQLSAQNVESFGVFGGISVPITIDQGLESDPRFVSKFAINGTPFGFHYGYDKPGLGFVISPSYLSVGQNYIIKNTTGGDVGSRNINMNYFSLPLALKFHLNSMAFFRLSMVAALDFCFLIDGTETFTHVASKLRYPVGVSVPTDPGYTVVYDGVFVPDVKDLVHVSKDKFNSFQLFGGVGMRADLDLNDHWSIMCDGRANFALFDSRTSTYLDQLKNPSGAADFQGNPGAPDLSGTRRDIYLCFTMGISRIITTKTKFKERHSAPIPKMSYPKSKKK